MGQPFMLPQGFTYMAQGGLSNPGASECLASSPCNTPTRRRRPRRGKGAAMRGCRFGMSGANECQELRSGGGSKNSSCTPAAADVLADILSGDPMGLAEDADLSIKVLNLLENKDKAKRSSILWWVRPAALELSLTVHGCRVIQKAFDIAGGEDRDAFATKLHGNVKELLESQHGNHVLQKCVEVLPPHSVQFIIDELACWPLSWIGVAKHRFGCRVIERLLEHCPEHMVKPLIDAIVTVADVLARHPYGNYVVQHALEYGTSVQRSRLVAMFVETGVAFLAQHRIASNVIERAIAQVSNADQQTIGLALLTSPQTLVVVGCSRYGTHVVLRLLEVLSPGPLQIEVVRQLTASLSQIRASKHSKLLVEKLTSLSHE